MHICLLFRRFLGIPQPDVQLGEQAHGSVCDDGAGREDDGRAHVQQGLKILRRHDAADGDHDVTAAFGFKGSPQGRHQCQMACCQRRHANHVHIVFHRLARDFFRR